MNYRGPIGHNVNVGYTLLAECYLVVEQSCHSKRERLSTFESAQPATLWTASDGSVACKVVGKL